MADALVALDDWIARLEGLPAAAVAAAPEVARVVDAELRANIAAGRAPDLKPWPKTADGHAPLQRAGDKLRVRAIGATVVATLSGVEALHDRGRAKGGVRRQIIPTGKAPGPVADAVRRVYRDAYARQLGGRAVTAVLALTVLYQAVVARFAAESAPTWTAPVLTGSGTTMPTGHASSVPTGTYQVRIRVVDGGTIGVVGITYQVSLDDGTTWGPVLDLDVATQINAGGLLVDLSAGTLEDDDEIAATTTDAVEPPEQSFGWREPDKRGKSAFRIVWVPGSLSGTAGKPDTARQPGRDERPLTTLQEQFTVYVEARDDSGPRDELAQYTAVRLLFDTWLRAVYLAARGTYTIDGTTWVVDKKEHRAGAALRVDATIQAVVPDLPWVAVTPTSARVAVTLEEDETEEVDATAS